MLYTFVLEASGVDQDGSIFQANLENCIHFKAAEQIEYFPDGV